MSEQEQLAEWETKLTKGDPSILSDHTSQDEIDKFLGMISTQDTSSQNRGVKAMLDKALQSYERLPMLEIVFDRFVRLLSTSMRNFTSDSVDIEIVSISSLRFGSYMNSIPLNAMITIFKALEWENFGLITTNSQLVYSLVDILFGGRKFNRPVKFEGRAYTTIEQGVLRQLSDLLLTDLGAAFDTLSPASFNFERIETNPRFVTISRPGDAAILLQLKVSMEERGGKIDILFPYATLEPIRELLLQVFMGEKFGKDSEWENLLTNEVLGTSVQIEAVLKNKSAFLEDIMKLKVGSTIIMENSPEDDILLHCSGLKMFSGKLGRVGNKIAVAINEKLNKKLDEEE